MHHVSVAYIHTEELISESCLIRLSFDCNYNYTRNFTPNEILFSAKSIWKVQFKHGLIKKDSKTASHDLNESKYCYLKPLEPDYWLLSGIWVMILPIFWKLKTNAVI